MNHKLKSVLQKGMTISYEYDFGYTTDLVISVHDYWESYRKKEKLTILSRNAPPEFPCGECHAKTAAVVCTQCIYKGNGFLCENCMEKHGCGVEAQLNICNSPRIGVCCYERSNIYPDQFVPDTDKH